MRVRELFSIELISGAGGAFLTVFYIKSRAMIRVGYFPNNRPNLLSSKVMKIWNKIVKRVPLKFI